MQGAEIETKERMKRCTEQSRSVQTESEYRKQRRLDAYKQL